LVKLQGRKRFTTETRRARRFTEKKGSGFTGFKDDQDERNPAAAGTEIAEKKGDRRKKLNRKEDAYRFAVFAFLLCVFA
jgi:hypothetical protein